MREFRISYPKILPAFFPPQAEEVGGLFAIPRGYQLTAIVLEGRSSEEGTAEMGHILLIQCNLRKKSFI